jgi:uncharacterized protein (TIGR03435 family)
MLEQGSEPPLQISLRPCIKDQGVALINVLEWAYLLPEFLIDGPYWIRRECVAWTPVLETPFSPGGLHPTPPLDRSQLQRELARKLQVEVHKEYRDIDVLIFRLPVDGTPLKLRRDNDGENGRAEPDHHSLKAMHAPISSLAGSLTMSLRRPVYDETQLSGFFSCDLKWSGDDVQKAVKEQLGLELQSAKRSVEMLVVDHAEKWQIPK